MSLDIKKLEENIFKIYNSNKEKFIINLNCNNKIFYKYGFPLTENKIKIYVEKNSKNGIILKNILTQIFTMFAKNLKIGNIFIGDESNFIQIIVNVNKHKTKIIESYENYFVEIINDKIIYLKNSILKKNLENIILEFENICIEDNFIWINITIDSVKINPNINNLKINNDKMVITPKSTKNTLKKFIHFKYNYSYNSKISFFQQLKIFLNLEKKDYMYSDEFYDEKLFNSFLILKNKINPFIDEIRKTWGEIYKDETFDFYNPVENIDNNEFLEISFDRIKKEENNSWDYSPFKNLYLKNNNKKTIIKNCYSKEKLKNIFKITDPFKIDLIIKPFIIIMKSHGKDTKYKLILRVIECIINHKNNLFNYNYHNCIDINNYNNLKLYLYKFPCILKYKENEKNKILNIVTNDIFTSNIDILYDNLSLKIEINDFNLINFLNKISNEIKKNIKEDEFVKNIIYKQNNIYLRLSKNMNSKDLNVCINNLYSTKNYIEKNISKIDKIISTNDKLKFKICFYIKKYKDFYKKKILEKKNYRIIPIIKEIIIEKNLQKINYKIEI